MVCLCSCVQWLILEEQASSIALAWSPLMPCIYRSIRSIGLCTMLVYAYALFVTLVHEGPGPPRGGGGNIGELKLTNGQHRTVL